MKRFLFIFLFLSLKMIAMNPDEVTKKIEAIKQNIQTLEIKNANGDENLTAQECKKLADLRLQITLFQEIYSALMSLNKRNNRQHRT